MTPAPATIAHYKLTAKLGEGGMGAVYRATDTKLGREVAIKVLPEAFAEDADRMARFQREAQVLASLNHPNIAAIYGIEQGAIVMELVEGENLRGPAPLETAIEYARQIAAGLEAAHEKGIVHRDLKPANIKVTAGGVVKLLDFGLAKATEKPQVEACATDSPTLSLAMTQDGTILGTAAYMSPEQARGKPVDKRSDIWAFGVVLYELLTGKTLFAGDTITDVLASVVKDAPDLQRVPSEVRRLLRSCLEKDPKQRLQAIGDWRLLLDDAAATALSPSRLGGRAWLPWVAAVLGVAIGAAGFVWRRPQSAAPVTVRFLLPLPAGTAESGSLAAAQAVPSPDGRSVAFIARAADGLEALWVRPMGSPAAHRLDKTEGANYPFWSPDSQNIAIFADEKLKRISAGGGSLQTICDSPRDNQARVGGDGGTWNAAGIIVFSLGSRSPLMRVPAAGGPAAPVTRLEAGETRHSWPQFLPDGRHFLFFAENTDPEKSAIYVQELESSQRILVMKSQFRAAWAAPGYLLFPRQETLFAQSMNATTFQLSGEPVSIAGQVSSNLSNGRSAFAVSGNGVLVYRSEPRITTRHLTWYGRDGKRLGVVGQAAEFVTVRLSPDEKSASVIAGSSGMGDQWVMDLTTGVLSRTTTEATGSAILAGAWSPDSQRLALQRANGTGLREFTVASGQSRVLPGADLFPSDYSPDGRELLCYDRSETRLAAISLDGDPLPRTISDTSYRKQAFRFSPDGRFVAYSSYEPGRAQIYIASFPSFAEKHQVSVNGGASPVWRKDGKELFFDGLDGTIQSADVQTGVNIQTGVPMPLFRRTLAAIGNWWPAGDGQRFLVIEGDPKQQTTPETTVVMNWTAELKQP